MEKTENQLKYENYKEQMKRLNSALAHGFNLEAMFIEYAIMEDRTESILRHADKWDAYMKKQNGRDPTINSKVKYIQKLADFNNDLLHKYFSDDLLDRDVVLLRQQEELREGLECRYVLQAFFLDPRVCHEYRQFVIHQALHDLVIIVFSEIYAAGAAGEVHELEVHIQA